MNRRRLTPPNPEEVCLPCDLGTGTLPLAQIGAAFVLTCITSAGDSDAMTRRLADPAFVDAMKALRADGWLTVTRDGGKLKWMLDIDAMTEGGAR